MPQIFLRFFWYIEDFLRAIRENSSFTDINQQISLVYNVIELVKMCKNCFSIVILSLIASNFFSILRVFYGIFLIFTGEISVDFHSTLCACYWSIFQFYFVFSYLRSIGAIENEFKQFLFSRDEDKTHKNDLRSLFIQQDLSFTAGDLFTVDYSLMTMFVSSIVSYLIVVIQFHLQVWIKIT